MRKVTDSYCTNHSGWETFNGKTVAKIIVPIAPSVSPTSTITYYGGEASLSCTSTGGRADGKTYEWYKSASSGGTYTTTHSTGTSYSPSELTSTTYYKCKVTDAEHSSGVWSDVITVTVRSKLTIGSITGATTTYSNKEVSLTVGNASGGNNSNYTYQWYESTNNGTTWTEVGTNSTSYKTTGSGQTKKIKVTVTDADNQHATAGPVDVTWRSPLTIGNISGGGGTTFSGNGVSLSVGAASGGNNSNYTYQWYESTNNGTTWTEVGTNSTSYKTTGSGQTKKIKVTVTDADNQHATAGPVDVTWRSPLTIGNISGGGGTTFSGNGVSLSVGAASGGNSSSYTYQWYESTNNGTTWTEVGTNSTSYTATGSGQTKKYYVMVTDEDNRTASASEVSVTWRSPLTIGSISGGGGTTFSGNGVSLSVGAASGGNSSSYTYQWYESTNNGTTWTEVGTNSTSYTATGSGQTKKYYVMVTDEDNRTASATEVSVTWRSALVAGTISGGGAYHYGAAVTLEAYPSGGQGINTYDYQWQIKTGSSWSDIANANSKTYSVTGHNQTLQYRVVVSGDNQTQTSNPVDVTWRPELVAGNITGGGVFISDAVVTLTANPSGGTDDGFTYQWQQSSDNAEWSNALGETNKTITVSGSDQTKYYRVIVGGDNQSKTSASVSVTWGEALIAGSISGATSTYTGNSVTLTASPASGGNGAYSYQWQVFDGANWSNIGGETGLTYAETNTNTSGVDLQKRYRVKVSDNSQTAYTEEVTVTWRTALVAGNIIGGTTTFSGNDVTLTANPTGGNGEYSYQWQVSENNTDWIDIEGATFSSLIETGDNETDEEITMYYRVVVSGDNQSIVSEVAEITRRPALKISGGIQTVDCNNIVYGGDTVNLAINVSGGDGTYNYQWYRKSADSDWIAVGDNSSSFFDSHETDTTISYQYKVVISGDSQELTTDVLQCNWVVSMEIDSLVYTQDTLSYGINHTELEAKMTNGSGFYDYQWQTLINGEWQDIPDSDHPILIVENITETSEYRCVVTDSLYPTHNITTGTAKLFVYPDLIPGTAFGTSYVLGNDTITIGGTTASGGNGEYRYRWEKRSASDSVFVPIDDTTATINVLPDCNTTYRRYDISGDQEKLAFEIQVDVPLLSGSISVDDMAEFYYAGQQLPLLQNETEASGGNVGGSASYQWYWKKGNDIDFTPIEGATAAEYQPTGLKETTSFYRAIVDSNETQYSNIIELKIRMPNIELANQKERYCKGDAVTINVSGIDNGNYKWFDASGNEIASGATLNLNSIEANTSLKLKTYINSNELLTEKDVNLTVVEMSPDFESDLITLDAGNVVHFTNNGTDYTQCEWDFGDGADGSYESNPWHYYNNDGVFDVKLRLTSSDGCVAEITKTGYISVNEATVTDVDESGAGSVSVYPNPASSYLIVETSGEAEVFIINNAGAALFKTKVFATEQIDISAYPEGTYTVIVVESNGNVHNEKIVKY